MLALEDRFAGFGTNNAGNGLPGGWGITAVIGDKETKFMDMEQSMVETQVKKAMESVAGVKRIYFDDDKHVAQGNIWLKLKCCLPRVVPCLELECVPFASLFRRAGEWRLIVGLRRD